MAKDMGKKVRKAKNNKRECVHKMVEAIISGDSDQAAEELRTYLQLSTRDMILGEAKDDSDEDDSDEDDSDEDDSDEDESDEDESDEDESDKKTDKKEKDKDC